MKKSIFVISAALLAANIYAFDSEASLKVTPGTLEYTKTEYNITEKFGDYYRSPRAKYLHTFDANGKELEVTELTSKDSIVDKISFAYDDKGNLESTTYTDADGKIQWKMVSVYDADGNKIEDSEMNPSDILTGKSIFKYTAGKQIEESYYNGDGVLLAKIITKLDDQGRTSEISQYRAEGTLEEKETFTYNESGKVSEITFTDENGIQIRKNVYRFDANEIITEEQTYDAKNRLSIRVIYRYDEAGRLIKKTAYNVAEKFGTTVNELAGILEYSYK